MYYDAEPNVPPTKPLPFLFKIGKLYQYSGEIEVLRTIKNKRMNIEDYDIKFEDIIMFLTRPRKFHGYFYCKVLNPQGFIAYFLWDEVTYDKFSLAII
jgi:hypothetical protein